MELWKLLDITAGPAGLARLPAHTLSRAAEMGKPLDDAELAAMDNASGARPPDVPLFTPTEETRRILPEPAVTFVAPPGSPAPVPLPPLDADVTAFEDAARKRVLQAIMHPRAQEALLEGLTSQEGKERRLWWAMLLPLVTKPPPNESKDTGNKVIISLNQPVPAPAIEEGPLVKGQRAIDVTP